MREEDKRIALFIAKRTSQLWKEGTDYWKAVDEAFKELKEKNEFKLIHKK